MPAIAGMKGNRSRVATTLSALLIGVLGLTACAPTTERTSTSQVDAAPPPQPAQVEPANDAQTATAPRYPLTIAVADGEVVIHTPQVERWDRFERLAARVALEVRPGSGDDAWFGSVLVEGETDIDFEERLVVIHDLKVVEHQVVGAGEAPEAVREMVREAMPGKARTVPLDTILRALPPGFVADNGRPGPEPEFSNQPPMIFVSTEPADLMIVDGDAVRAPIGDLPLEFALNTNWDLFRDKDGEQWYVRQGKAWRTAPELSSADWRITRRLPDAFSRLPDDANWEETRAAIPPQRVEDTPRLIVSLEPAELILIDGDPALEAIPEAGISWVSNTEADVFVYQGAFYYLVSGRWFQAATLDGDWHSVERLPDGFAFIPEEHPRAHVLAAVPNTTDARAALIEAQIPRTVTVSVDEVPEIKVDYAGLPKFEPIEGTSLQRAVNTASQVFLAGDRYYLCNNAIWFVADDPAGPWSVATEIPAEIYAIPASDPAHNVTYAYVYPQSSTSTTVSVTYAYLPGYYGVYVGTGAVMFGTGFYYPPYYGYYPWGYPGYWYYPRSYGYGSWYNPATGTYGRGAVSYGPYGGARALAAYNPRTGTFARGWSTWDSDELYRQGGVYNPRTGTFGAGNLYYNFDEKEGWSQRLVQRGDRWVYGETTFDGNRGRTEYETARGITGTSERIRTDGQIRGAGTVNAGDRQARTESTIDRRGYEARIEGEQGRSAEVSRDWGERGRDVSLQGADGGTASGTTYRTRQGTVAVGDGGDLYASRDGNVYRRNDSGSWSRYENGGWNDVNRGSSRNVPNLNRQYEARRTGARNYDRFQSTRPQMGGGINRGNFRGRRR